MKMQYSVKLLIYFCFFAFSYVAVNEFIVLPYQTPDNPVEAVTMSKRNPFINLLVTGLSYLTFCGSSYYLIKIFGLTRSKLHYDGVTDSSDMKDMNKKEGKTKQWQK